jgi:Ribbon-helix-helix protein, copG family
MSDEQEYVLGQDVTEAAASRTKGGTTVLSVRLTTEELAAIEAVANETGRTLSQVVREAIHSCIQMVRNSQPMITVSIRDIHTTSFGGQKATTTAMGVPSSQSDPVAV